MPNKEPKAGDLQGAVLVRLAKDGTVRVMVDRDYDGKLDGPIVGSVQPICDAGSVRLRGDSPLAEKIRKVVDETIEKRDFTFSGMAPLSEIAASVVCSKKPKANRGL